MNKNMMELAPKLDVDELDWLLYLFEDPEYDNYPYRDSRSRLSWLSLQSTEKAIASLKVRLAIYGADRVLLKLLKKLEDSLDG